MVDPNPFRGMPIQLQRYWLAGKGALKIRWGLPHDFNRCVRNLRKYFPKNPEGLCNILHQKALGAPPGKGHPGEAAATALLAAMPMLGKNLWAGPIAPIGRPTGEPRRIRVFEHGALSHRALPLPLAYQKVSANGHEGSVTVGRMLGIVYGPDEKGLDWAYAWGDWLDENIVPEVKEARYMVQQGVVGPSIDPGGKVTATMNPETGVEHMTAYTIAKATLVAVPAFTHMRLVDLDEEGEWPDDDADMPYRETDEDDGDCGCNKPYTADVGETFTFTVNPTGWRGLPLAPRDSVFDNDDAVKRIAAWAQVNAEGADVSKLRRAFMWRDPTQPETTPTSYRLPVGDIINGRLTLIYHAIYAAAALLSGAHGGLPGVPENDRNALRNTITDIYGVMATEFNDPSIRAPWDRPEREGERFAMDDFAADKKPYGDVQYADPGYQGDKVKRYPIDTEQHVRAAWSYINQPGNAKFYSAAQLKLIKRRIMKAAEKYGIKMKDDGEMEAMSMDSDSSHEMSLADQGYPLQPPAWWFDNPELPERTALTVDDDGRVYGHLAAWNECHRDVTNRECVLAPKSLMDYKPFHLGRIKTEDGETLRCGKIVMDTRHADIRLGYAAAALHYDDTGDEVAVVRAGEDEFGIWVAGAIIPEATPRKVAKLRRSPLSGDWRAVEGNLELTAALAVNVPAFPVYAMQDEERTALTAAGSVIQEDDIEDEFEYQAAEEDEEVEEDDTYDADQDDRGWRLRELLDEEDSIRQELRGDRFSFLQQIEYRDGEYVFAATTEAPPAPAPAAAPVAPPKVQDPTAKAVVQTAQQSQELYSQQAIIERERYGRYSTVEEPSGSEDEPVESAPPVTPPAPQQPAPKQQKPSPAPIRGQGF
jgi:hypothetical protein